MCTDCNSTICECVRKLEGHIIVEHQISYLWNTKHFCNMLTYGVTKKGYYILHQYADVPLDFVALNNQNRMNMSKSLRWINCSPTQAEPEHKGLRISYLIFDYWALHICLDITVCSALVWNATFLFLGKINLDMRTLYYGCVACCHAVRNEAARILMLAASNMISKNYDYFLSYSLQEQQASNHFSFNQLIIYLHSILIDFLLAAVS
ncbi:hypothetical protein ACJX0J_042072, partial [Zea mays]